MYGDTCDSSLLNAIHEVLDASSFKPKIIAYYGDWRIYGGYKYYPHIPRDKEAEYSCTDAWSYAQPVSGPRNSGITNSIAGKLDYVNNGFATISYDESNGGSFFVNSPDPNADYASSALPSGAGCLEMLRNPLCLSPYIGAYESGDCTKSVSNSGGYMVYD